MRTCTLLLPCLALLGGPVAGAAGQSLQFKIDTRATYLHASANDGATDAPAIPLALLGAVPGQSLHMTSMGAFDNGPAGDEVDILFGVFSGSAELLPKAELHRVVHALDAGKDVGSSPTAFGNEPTEIAEDFLVSIPSKPETVVQIPAGATHLFVAVADTYYEDNSDPNGDYHVVITVVGTWSEVGTALAGSAGEPHLTGTGLMLGGDAWTLALSEARPAASAWLVVGFSELLVPFKGGVLVPSPDLVLGPLPTGPAGTLELATTWPAGVPPFLSIWLQCWIQDPVAPLGFAASQGLRATTP